MLKRRGLLNTVAVLIRQHAFDLFERTWAAIPHSDFDELILYMQNRCVCVIRVNHVKT